MSRTSATIKVGESLSLKATSDSVLDISFTWSSNNNPVASVTKDGKVYGNKVGSATITAKSENGIVATCKVTVQNKANNPDSGEVKLSGASSSNISANDYYTWSSVVKSNLTENSDKTLTRVESTSNGVLVEKYSANGKPWFQNQPSKRNFRFTAVISRARITIILFSVSRTKAKRIPQKL